MLDAIAGSDNFRVDEMFVFFPNVHRLHVGAVRLHDRREISLPGCRQQFTRYQI